MYSYDRTAAGKDKYEILLPNNKKSKHYNGIEEAAVAAVKQLVKDGRGDLTIQVTTATGATGFYRVDFRHVVGIS
jgi:hypothetical protein